MLVGWCGGWGGGRQDALPVVSCGGGEVWGWRGWRGGHGYDRWTDGKGLMCFCARMDKMAEVC